MSFSSTESVEIAIVGGGLGGLIAAHLLHKRGYQTVIIEKKKYPFHRVCGEYISNEVKPFLFQNGLFPQDINRSEITRFQLTSIKGKALNMPLDLGGFGVSRWAYDQWLADHFENQGGLLRQGTAVSQIESEGEQFHITLKDNTSYLAKMVIGAWGKRSNLDKAFDRPFMRRKSPYVGVKYHIHIDYPQDLVALHNFKGGYCGINKIEDDRYNLCYLVNRANLKSAGSVNEMEKRYLRENPHLDRIFETAEFILEKPEVINEITFEKKGPIVDDIPVIGDSAGMITPLCGNGMAMSIHAAKLLVDAIDKHSIENQVDRKSINKSYAREWSRIFSNRLWVGRKIQSLFGGGTTSGIAVGVGHFTRPIAEFLMSKTHGQPFS